MAFDRIQEEEAAHFLMNVLATPEKLFDHIRTEAGTVILKIIYGYTAKNSGEDPLINLAGKAMWVFAESTVPGKWAVDNFPFRESPCSLHLGYILSAEDLLSQHSHVKTF